MLRKVLVLVLTVIMISAMAIPALAAFEPDKDPALTKYYSFEDTIGDAKLLGKEATDFGFYDGGTINYTDGVHGKAFYFDGKTGLEIGKDVVKGTNFTIALWMNPEAITPWTAAFFARRFEEGDFAQYWLSIAPRTDLDANPDRKMMFWTCGQEDYSYWFDGVTTIAPELNKWLHVAVTLSGEDIVVYGDGQIIFDTRTTDANYTNNIYALTDAWTLGGATFYIGANEFADAAFQGKIDEVYTFNRALSQSEIVELMNYNPNPAAPEETPDDTAPEQPAVETPPAVNNPPAATTGDISMIFVVIAVLGAATVAFTVSKKRKNTI